MRKSDLLVVLTVVFFFALFVNSGSQQELRVPLSPSAWIAPGGAVEGGDAVWLPHGDIINVRNVQGGTPDDPNLDLGAGSSTYRGTLGINYDVGRCTIIYDGHKVKQVVVCPGKRPWFRRAPRIGGRPPS